MCWYLHGIAGCMIRRMSLCTSPGELERVSMLEFTNLSKQCLSPRETCDKLLGADGIQPLKQQAMP